MDKDYIWYVALLEWCKDHYENFDALPMEFEYNDKVYTFDQFIKYIPSDFEERWNGQGSLSRST